MLIVHYSPRHGHSTAPQAIKAAMMAIFVLSLSMPGARLLSILHLSGIYRSSTTPHYDFSPFPLCVLYPRDNHPA